MLLVEIKDFNALIDSKPFLDQLMKNKQEANGKLVEMTRNNNYTTDQIINSLDYLQYQNNYKFIGKDLSMQTNATSLQ